MKNNSKNKTRKKNIAKLLSIVLTTLLLIVLLISKYNDAQTSKNQEIKYSEIINYIEMLKQLVPILILIRFLLHLQIKQKNSHIFPAVMNFGNM